MMKIDIINIVQIKNTFSQNLLVNFWFMYESIIAIGSLKLWCKDMCDDTFLLVSFGADITWKSNHIQ